MKTRKKRIIIGFEGTADDAAHLAALAKQTCRVPSQVLRHLLRNAQLTGVPDIQTSLIAPESVADAAVAP